MSQIAQQTSNDNYLESPVLAAYFSAREHQAHYYSLKHVGPRRQAYPALIASLQGFLDCAADQSARDLLDARIFCGNVSSRLASAVPPASESLAARARRQDPRGYDLLALDGSRLTFDSLKRAYRAAAQRHHPDRGGSNDAMRDVNVAHDQFHELIFHELIAGETEESPAGDKKDHASVASAGDFVCSVAMLLTDIHLDEYAPDVAWTVAEALMRAGYPNSAIPSAHARDTRWGEPLRDACLSRAYQVARALTGCRLQDQARKAREFARRFLSAPPAPQSPLATSLASWLQKLEDAPEIASYSMGRLMTVPQARNSLRLGLIDKRRHDAALLRLSSQTEDEAMKRRILREYVRERGFLKDLPADRRARSTLAVDAEARVNLVPEPEWNLSGSRVDGLSSAQLSEYLRAFGPDSNLDLIRKYHFVRLTTLVRSLISESPPAFGAVCSECQVISELLSDPRRGAREHWLDLLAFARLLASIPREEARARCSVLRAIDEKYQDTAGTLSITAGGAADGSFPDAELQVGRGGEFCQFAQKPVADLERALRTGSSTRRADRRSEEAASRADNKSLATLQSTELYARASTWRSDPSDPIACILAIEPYCDALLELGSRTTNTEHLQIGYWINCLTIACVSAGQWTKAVTWIDRFFGLPERYRRRSPPSEQKLLRARHARATKRLAPNEAPSRVTVPATIEPPIVRTLRRAEQFQSILERGEASSQADLARRVGLTKARVSQILKLLKISRAARAMIDRLAATSPCSLPSEDTIRRLADQPEIEQTAALRSLFPRGDRA